MLHFAFVGPRIMIYFYSKTNQMHNFWVYWISLYVFRTVFPSIIRSSRLYIQHQVYVIQVSWLLASGHEMERTVWHMLDAVCTVLNSWWWMERQSETCRVIFNKLENCASNWFYYRNMLHSFTSLIMSTYESMTGRSKPHITNCEKDGNCVRFVTHFCLAALSITNLWSLLPSATWPVTKYLERWPLCGGYCYRALLEQIVLMSSSSSTNI